MSGAVLGALGAVFAASLLLALPASAMVTGFDTGYQYRQGLATGAGGQLMSEAGTQPSPVAVTSDGSALIPNSGVSAPVDGSVTTPVVEPSAAPAPAPATEASVSFMDVLTPSFVAGALFLLALVGIGIWALTRRSRDDEEYRPIYS